MDVDAMEQQILTINLQHCLARGEAAFLRANDLQAVRLNWENGLLASSERMVTAAGGPSQPRQLGHVQINLRHVTAMVHGGLALLTNSKDAPYQLLTEINSHDSIVVSSAMPPLVEQRGSNSLEEFRRGCNGAATTISSTGSMFSGRSKTRPDCRPPSNCVLTSGRRTGEIKVVRRRPGGATNIGEICQNPSVRSTRTFRVTMSSIAV